MPEPDRMVLKSVSSRLAPVRDHRRVFQEYFYVYPVISRRARGLSLGINLNPDKVCNFDCIYCEVDRRTPARVTSVDPVRLRDELSGLVEYVVSGGLAQAERFREAGALARVIKDFAFSGDGEPTLLPNFAECVQIAADVKRAFDLPTTKIVLITDAAGLDKVDVQRGLEIMDANQGEIWGKLDAGTKAYFRLVNRTTIRFERILKNLLETARVRPIVIQSLFLKVHGALMPAEELAAYCERLNGLVRAGARIKAVHAYTVARPTPETFATKLDGPELGTIAGEIRARTGLGVETFE
jgi:wyosine [tRNA(Phe)-imidazoG37] synthetase (radical SAM superfamily)